ncbi:hypothetical protein GCM10027040_10200 [Halomonas shantousis]
MAILKIAQSDHYQRHGAQGSQKDQRQHIFQPDHGKFLAFARAERPILAKEPGRNHVPMVCIVAREPLVLARVEAGPGNKTPAPPFAVCDAGRSARTFFT